jgi:tRNA G18 (ribose-2'-O)-methylase SpoU
LIEITDASDQRIDDYVRLRDVNLRRHLESERGLFIAEGEKVIRRALEAGFQPRSFLLAERWLQSLSDLLDDHPEAPIYLVTERLAEEITGFHVHRGALASLHRQQLHTVDDLLRLDRLVVLEDVVDHTNVGAILRSAAGLGWQGALLSPRSADPLYRRAIKVSMGSVFSLPWARLADWGDAISMLNDHGFTTVALALTDDAEDLDRVRQQLVGQPKIAIMVGTEGAGLSKRWIDQARIVGRIPMQAGIDSLNVAAATAVACYVLSPERRG